MVNSIQSIALDLLVPHPDNPNRQSRANFAKLVRNIERSGRYEPILVRPCPHEAGYFQIINGHHRRQALAKLGYKNVDVIVWDIDDEQADVLLATLNRLCGSDELGKKIKLLNRLKERMSPRELVKILPQTAKQFERLTGLHGSILSAKPTAKFFANTMVFFINDEQKQIIENALSAVMQRSCEKTRAARNAAALTYIAESFTHNLKHGL